MPSHAPTPAPTNGHVSHWFDGPPVPRPPLPGSRDADICIVGAGYTGLWTAYYLKQADPSLRIVVLEARFAGFGASGRNGGWLSGLVPGDRERMARQYGRDAVVAWQRALNDAVDEVIDVAALENIDASGRPAGEPFDVLLYPSVLSLAPDVGGSPSAGSNNRLSPFSGFPALTMPAGMADTDPALPVGMEMLAREFDEGTLIKLAYAYQELAEPRQAPTFTPELEEQPEPAPVALID